MEKYFWTLINKDTFTINRIIIAVAATLLFWILSGIFSKLLLIICKQDEKDNKKVKGIYNPIRLLFIFIGLYIGIRLINPTVLFKTRITKYLKLITIALVTYAIGKMVSPNSKFERLLKDKMNKVRAPMARLICKIIKIVIYFVGATMFIYELGYNINGLIAGLGIGGVTFALAAKDTASNVIAAFVMIFEKTFLPGDWVTINDVEGTVEEFTFRSVKIRCRNNTIVSIPNSIIVTSNVTNWTKQNKRLITADLVLEFNTPLTKVEKTQKDLIKMFECEDKVLKDIISVKFDSIKDDGYNLKIIAYTPITDYLEYLTYLDTINYKIMNILHNNKVELAYKSQTLYLKKD